MLSVSNDLFGSSSRERPDNQDDLDDNAHPKDNLERFLDSLVSKDSLCSKGCRRAPKYGKSLQDEFRNPQDRRSCDRLVIAVKDKRCGIDRGEVCKEDIPPVSNHDDERKQHADKGNRAV